MTDDAKNLLRECLQYLYESAPAEVYDRITAHLAAPAPEPIGEVKESGVVWMNQNPHAYPMGTKFCAIPPLPKEEK